MRRERAAGMGLGVRDLTAVGLAWLLAACRGNELTAPGNEPGAFELRGEVPAAGPGFALALRQSLGVPMRAGNLVDWREDGAVFDGLADDLKKARGSMHVVMYIWEKGAASDRITAALIERARAGVSCRIVIDDFGSPEFARTVQPALAEAGCEVRYFRPLPQASVLTRNHRKVIVIDGRVAYTGGFGIRDNWLGDGVHEDRWRDASARFTGPAVAEAQQAFAENWQEAGGELLPAEAFPAIEPQGPSAAALVTSTASPALTRAERLTQLMIAAAHRRLWIANAYFVPSRGILKLLERKASEGVDVRILVAGKKSDSKTAFVVQQGLYGDLREKGARVFEYQPSMMHSKTMLVDDRLALVGSVNLDPFSLRSLDEAALVVDDATFAATLAARFEADCALSIEQK